MNLVADRQSGQDLRLPSRADAGGDLALLNVVPGYQLHVVLIALLVHSEARYLSCAVDLPVDNRYLGR
ncbi:MAG TPA: hypothetical protein DCQ04_14180 [Actinobacteria bacterium]|nr:hypothetical protein [Actinomycetota bacterium]